jgi:hypothetical protein
MRASPLHYPISKHVLRRGMPQRDLGYYGGVTGRRWGGGVALELQSEGGDANKGCSILLFLMCGAS